MGRGHQYPPRTAPALNPYQMLTVVRCVWSKGRKGEKGTTSRAPVIVTDNNGLPTGFIEGPPGAPGRPGIPGKKVTEVVYTS